MKKIIKEDHVFYKWQGIEYHLDIDEYNKLGEKEADKFVKTEIQKKLNAKIHDKLINFEKARSYGFCEYGIKHFCHLCNLNLDKTYTLDEVYKKMNIKAFLEYPEECIKLFKEKTLDKFGGVLGFLDNDNVDLDTRINIVLYKVFIKEKDLHLLSIKFAESVLHNFENKFPEDDRPRKAIEAKKLWLEGKINDDDLKEAESAARSAWSAARSAAWSAAESARSAASAASAAWSAAESARSAWSAASAARSAASEKQIEMIKEVLNGKISG